MPALPDQPAAPMPEGFGQDGSIYVNLDQWDGYQAERRELVAAFSGVENVVAITGDLHTYLAGYIKEDFDGPLSPPVGVYFMAGSVTSANLEELIAGYEVSQGPAYEDLVLLFKASNPHLEFFNSNIHGYNLLEITPGSLTCTMKAVNTVLRPEAVLNTLRVFRVGEGSNTIQDVTVQSLL